MARAIAENRRSLPTPTTASSDVIFEATSAARAPPSISARRAARRRERQSRRLGRLAATWTNSCREA